MNDIERYLKRKYPNGFISVPTKGGVLVAVAGEDKYYPSIHVMFISDNQKSKQYLANIQSKTDDTQFFGADVGNVEEIEDDFEVFVSKNMSGDKYNKFTIRRYKNKNDYTKQDEIDRLNQLYYQLGKELYEMQR